MEYVWDYTPKLGHTEEFVSFWEYSSPNPDLALRSPSQLFGFSVLEYSTDL